jgi:hypothetical protein
VGKRFDVGYCPGEEVIVMLRCCAWCHKVMGSKWAGYRLVWSSGGVTHSICESCKAIEIARLNEKRRQLKATA